ncbi:MAG: L,D-transpeptidase [Bacteroidales bacterium]
MDYPNAEDTKRFRNNKKNGRIPGDAEIGGLIEIHGKGGKGSDWTDGCVALRNEDMDAVFAACPNGTRVTIVGSTRPLEDAE